MAVDRVMVERLVQAALAGMQQVDGFTTSELLSASLTLCDHITHVMIEHAPATRGALQEAVAGVLLGLADPSGTKH